ncbi:MAG: LysE family transporter, partial [Pseudomonadota bacterium]
MEQFTLYLPGILLSFGAFLMAIASPGPNVMAVIGTSMAVNRASGVALAMGVAFGSLTWAILTAVGLSAVLATYASALLA